MDEKLVKSLTSLIDETIAEIEDLKKSRFSAAEVNLAGPGEDGIAGKPASGCIGKKEEKEDKEEKVAEIKAEIEVEGDEDEEEKKKKKLEIEKGINEEAAKAEKDKKEDEEEDEVEKGINEEAAKAEKEEKEKKQPKEGYEIKKSLEEQEALMKSYVDEKIGGLEEKLAGILKIVEEIGSQPVAKRSYANVVPLQKSEGDVEPLSKADVAGKLFELKKSGTYVDSADIIAAETGGDLQAITSKYNLK